jgi:hypothetical protein
VQSADLDLNDTSATEGLSFPLQLTMAQEESLHTSLPTGFDSRRDGEEEALLADQ